MKRLLLLLPLLMAATPIANASPSERVDKCVAFLVRSAATNYPDQKFTPIKILKKCACVTEKLTLGVPVEGCMGEL